jgi:6-phosphogluconolactonase (cycloisomerase 2 family)
MKLNTIGRATLASIVSLAVGLGITACSRDYVLAYVYATTAKPLAAGSNNGGVSAYAVDYQTGSLVPLADSPLAAGKNPVTLVAAPNGLSLYVVNHDDSTVMQFSIGTDGKLYLKNTINITGSFPTAAAIDTAGKFLYVTFTYQLGPGGQQLYSPASPGPGGITVFPINADGGLGTASTVNVGTNPVAIAISPVTASAPSYVYVVDQEASPNATVLGFAQNASTGALTPTPGTVITTVAGKTVATGYGAGVTPSAIAADASSRFVYVTDQATNQVFGNGIGAGGTLVPMNTGPVPTGQLPVAVTVDPRAKFLYVANNTSGSVSAYAIDQASGAPVGTAGSTSTTVGPRPNCVAIEPALGRYLYTSNNLDNSISALKLDPHTGALTQVQNTPFPSSGLPTCVVAVRNGTSHPNQIVNP